MLNKQITLTGAIFLCALLFFESTNIDLWVQDYFFNFHLQRWILDRDNTVLKFIFYDGIKMLFIGFVVLLLAGLIFFRNSKSIAPYKYRLLLVCISAILVPLFIGSLKAVTNTPCPRDISRYGGKYPYVTVLQTYPESFTQDRKIRCYPAGHASGAFALLSLYFLFTRKKNKRIALAVVMTIGWSVGGYKMLIGDHFLSHTVATMILAWLIVLIVAKGFSKKLVDP